MFGGLKPHNCNQCNEQVMITYMNADIRLEPLSLGAEAMELGVLGEL